jgi:hypothetical protein
MDRPWMKLLETFRVRMGLIELCVWIALNPILNYVHNANSHSVSFWVLETLLAANVLRSGIALVAYFTTRGRHGPARQWQRIACLTSLHVVFISATILCGLFLCFYISFRSFGGEDCPVAPRLCGERPDPGLLPLVIWINVVFSIFSTVPWWRSSPDCPQSRPPKPEVTSFVVHDVASECRDSACVICLEDFSVDCTVGRLPCGHIFHYDCVDGWLMAARPQAWCPMRCPSNAIAPPTRRPSAIRRPAAPQRPEVQGTSPALSHSVCI